jgi:hypothetical protein
VPRAAGAQPRVGTISELARTVTVERNGRSTSAFAAMAVETHDEFKTGERARLVIALADNSRLELSQLTTLALEQTPGPRNIPFIHLTLKGGEVRGLLSPSRAATPNLEVATANAFADVRGASFAVGFSKRSAACGYRDSSDIAVHDGTVVVARPAAPTDQTPVYSGYETVVCAVNPPLPPGPLGLAGMDGPFGAAGAYAVSGVAIAMPPPICPPCPIIEVR